MLRLHVSTLRANICLFQSDMWVPVLIRQTGDTDLLLFPFRKMSIYTNTTRIFLHVENWVDWEKKSGRAICVESSFFTENAFEEIVVHFVSKSDAPYELLLTFELIRRFDFLFFAPLS